VLAVEFAVLRGKRWDIDGKMVEPYSGLFKQ
jgi:hypothetical protein